MDRSLHAVSAVRLHRIETVCGVHQLGLGTTERTELSILSNDAEHQQTGHLLGKFSQTSSRVLLHIELFLVALTGRIRINIDIDQIEQQQQHLLAKLFK